MDAASFFGVPGVEGGEGFRKAEGTLFQTIQIWLLFDKPNVAPVCFNRISKSAESVSLVSVWGWTNVP